MQASRFTDFECNCCVGEACEIFCISFFSIYGVFMFLFVAFTVYYIHQKQQGCAGTRPLSQTNKETADGFSFCEVHYFDQILIYIILELASRMAFLATGFVALFRGS